MYRLICAGISRFAKNRLLWIFLIGMFAFGAIIGAALNDGDEAVRMYYLFALPVGVLVGTFTCLFTGTDYSDGTIRNKLVVGHSRGAVYLSNLFFSVISGIFFIAAFLVPISAVCVIRFGEVAVPEKGDFIIIGIALLMTAAFSSLATLVVMLTQNKAVSVVSFVVAFMALLMFCSWLNSALNQSMYVEGVQVVYGADGEIDESNSVEIESRPNPNYVSGVKREIYQFLVDFLPTGQVTSIIGFQLVNLWQPAVYSLIIILVSTIAGVLVFRRQNIK